MILNFLACQSPKDSWMPKIYKTSYREKSTCQLIQVNDHSKFIYCESPKFNGYFCMNADDLGVVYARCLEKNK